MKINEIKPIEAVKKCDIPVLFIHAKDDELVNFQHTLDLYNNYRGISKQIKEVNGGHNGKRPSTIMENISKFFSKYLQINYQNYEEDINSCEENKNLEEKVTTKQDEEYNVIDNLPQKKNKTIYEAMGIPNPILSSEKLNENEEKIEEKEQLKNDINLNKNINNNEIIEIKKEEEKLEEKIKENNQKENELKQANNETNNEDKNIKKNLTFYNTNKNFDSYFSACINNNDINKLNQEKSEDNNEKKNENNININMNMPKRKTIYDDLNLRFKNNA